MSDLAVAHEIKRQIGPVAFMLMGTKVSSFFGGEKFLQFKIGSNEKKIASIRVTLELNDTYKVSFYNRTGKIINEVDDVYVDMLHGIIESNTGLYLSF